MEFKVEKYYKENFSELLESTCKKFKVDYTLTWSEEQIIGHKEIVRDYGYNDAFDTTTFMSFGVPAQIDPDKNPIYGYIATVEVPEIEKMESPDYSYLGCVKFEEGITTVHPTTYAEEKGFSLNSLKDEIKSFPCRECGKKIYRTIIHVFEDNKTNEIAVFGSGCAKKKFGIDFQHVMDRFFKTIEVIKEGYDEEDGYFGGGSYYSKVEYAPSFVFMTFFNIYKRGYVSGKVAWEQGGASTKDMVWNALYMLMSSDRQNEKDRRNLREEMDDFKEEHGHKLEWEDFKTWMIEEFRATLDESTDFGHNMLQIVDQIATYNEFANRMAGYVCYIVFRYYQDKLIPKAPKEEWNTDYSNFKVGDKVKDFGPIRVRIVGLYSFETQFGMKYIYTMRDLDNGYKFKWFATVPLNEEFDHEIYSGTIKDLEDHEKYGKAIVLTRCRANVIREEAAA